MQSTIHAARGRGHVSRHERQLRARVEAFSRRTPVAMPSEVPMKLAERELELIERLVRQDRTAVSSAVLAIAGVGSGSQVRRAVLERVAEATRWAQAEGAITAERGGQIARHVKRALKAIDVGVAA